MFIYLPMLQKINCPSLGHKVSFSLKKKIIIMTNMIKFYLWKQSKGYAVSLERWIWLFFYLAWPSYPPYTSRIQFINQAVVLRCCYAGPAPAQPLVPCNWKSGFFTLFPPGLVLMFKNLSFNLYAVIETATWKVAAFHLVSSRC